MIIRDDQYSNNIVVRSYFYAIYDSAADNVEDIRDRIVNDIEQRIFPNGIPWSNGQLSGDNIVGSWVEVEVRYDNITKIYTDLGNPNEWSVKFKEYYFVPVINDLVVFMYGITAATSNERVYEEFMVYPMEPVTTMGNISTTTGKIEGPDGIKQDDTWMIIGIVFIVLFVLSVCVIIYLIMFKDKDRSTRKGGYSRAGQDEVEMRNTTQSYDM